MHVREKLEKLVYEYFINDFPDEVAKDKAKKTAVEIISLMQDIEHEIITKDLQSLTRSVHTLKHLLLYADLDELSDMCQDLESDIRIGEINIPLKEEIFKEIVK